VRIAIVGPAHPYKGGGARHTTELAHRLTAAGHDVWIESWRAQYPAKLYPGQQTVDEADGDPFPRTRRRLAWYAPQTWLAAGRRLRRADLVVFVLLTPIQVPPYLVMLTTLGRTTRTVVLCHNVLPHERRPGDRPLVRALLRRCGAALVHSAAEQATAHDLAPGVRTAVAALPPHHPPALSAERPAVTAPGIGLLFFGIVRPYKGLDILLRALAKAPPELTLTVAGEFWGGTAATEKLIADLGLTGRVALRAGYVPASQVPALFAAADVLVMPYRAATASQNPLIAFAYGLPVIATQVGAIADQITDGVNGLTVVRGRVDDLARALRLVAEPGTLERLRAGVRSAGPQPSWDDYVAALLRLPALHLCGGGPSGRRSPRSGRRASSPSGTRARRRARIRSA
jgi:glycosyltransferase involved in cell wall biosynthesis